MTYAWQDFSDEELEAELRTFVRKEHAHAQEERTQERVKAVKKYEDEKQWSSLYVLAQSLVDESFLLHQAQRFTSQSDAPLPTLIGALKGAMDEDDAAKMAVYTLAHASWNVALTTGIQNQSPLDALHGGDLQRAWERADLYDIKQQIFWYLLLTWESMDKRKLTEAEDTLKQLFKSTTNRPVLGLYEHEAERAADLLVHVREIVQDFTSLRRSLLDDDGHATLCQHLINEDDWNEADVVAKDINMPSQKANTWITIAEAQIRREEQGWAQKSLKAALEAAVGSDYIPWRVKELCRIAVLQAQAEAHDAADTTLSAALETAQQLKEDDQRGALRDIAVAQAQVGDFAAAFQTVRNIKGFRSMELKEALAGIVIAQAEAGNVDAAEALLDKIDDLDLQRLDEFPRVVQTIVTMQTKKGDLGVALRTFGWGMEVQGPEKRGEDRILAAMVTVLAEAGDITTARQIAILVKHPAWKAEALSAIAKAQAKAGNPSAARETFAVAIATVQSLAEENKIASLGEIAIAQAQVREIAAEVNRTCAPVLEAAQKMDEKELGWFIDAAVRLARAGAPDSGQAILAACVPTAQRIRDRDHRVQALWKIGMAQIQAGAHDVGRRTLGATLVENPAKGKNSSRQLRLMDAVKAQVLAGRLDTAYAYWYAARQQKHGHDSGWRSWALRAITKTQAQAASQIGDQECPSGDNLHKVWVLRKISMAQAIEGDYDAAWATLERAQQIVPELLLEWEQAEALVMIAETQTQLGDGNAAGQTIVAAVNMANQLTNVTDQSRILRILNLMLVHLPTWAGVLKAGHYTISEAQREQIRVWLAQAQAQLGNLDAARKTAEGIHTCITTNTTTALSRTEYLQEQALETIAIELAQRGDICAARQIEEGLQQHVCKAVVLAAIATKQEQDGQDEEAESTLTLAFQEQILNGHEQSWTRRRIADIQLKAGLNARAVDAALAIETDQDIYLPEVAAELAKAADATHFKRLLPLCANDLGTAYRMCGLLAQLYPEQAAAIAEEIKRNDKERLARNSSSSKLFAMYLLLSKYNNHFG